MGGAVDQFGVVSVFATGAIRYDYKENFRSDGKRFDFEINSPQFASCELTGYFSCNNPWDDEVSGKMGGGKHTDGTSPKCYDIGCGIADGKTRVRTEYEHPTGYEAVPGNGTTGAPMAKGGQYTGYKFVKSNQADGVLCQVWQDTGDNRVRPSNQWKMLLSLTEKQYNWQIPGNDHQETLRVDGGDATSSAMKFKWISCRSSNPGDSASGGMGPWGGTNGWGGSGTNPYPFGSPDTVVGAPIPPIDLVDVSGNTDPGLNMGHEGDSLTYQNEDSDGVAGPYVPNEDDLGTTHGADLGQMQFVALTNAQGQPAGYDSNGDGKADAFDTDNDGVVDALDGDGDGKADAFDTDNDGIIDAYDTDRDGVADRFGGTGKGGTSGGGGGSGTGSGGVGSGVNSPAQEKQGAPGSDFDAGDGVIKDGTTTGNPVTEDGTTEGGTTTGGVFTPAVPDVNPHFLMLGKNKDIPLKTSGAYITGGTTTGNITTTGGITTGGITEGGGNKIINGTTVGATITGGIARGGVTTGGTVVGSTIVGGTTVGAVVEGGVAFGGTTTGPVVVPGTGGQTPSDQKLPPVVYVTKRFPIVWAIDSEEGDMCSINSPTEDTDFLDIFTADAEDLYVNSLNYRKMGIAVNTGSSIFVGKKIKKIKVTMKKFGVGTISGPIYIRIRASNGTIVDEFPSMLDSAVITNVNTEYTFTHLKPNRTIETGDIIYIEYPQGGDVSNYLRVAISADKADGPNSCLCTDDGAATIKNLNKDLAAVVWI